MQSVFQGSKVRGETRLGAERQGAAQNIVLLPKVSQRANKRKSVLVPFEGTLNRVFFVRVYFEKARLFGTVSVQILTLWLCQRA